jgi:hypothetical protein
MLIHGREWNILCDKISKEEREEIEATIVSTTTRPRTIFLNEDRLDSDLLVKVKKCLDILPKDITRVTRGHARFTRD